MTPAGRNAATRDPVLEIDAVGNKRWKVDGLLHREDGPAIETAMGSKHWYHHGQRHRDDGPAIEYASGTKEWWLSGQPHREDGPAIEDADGTVTWYLHGKRYTKPAWLRELLKGRPLTTRQYELLNALSENWEGIPELLYETVTHLAD